MVQLTTSLNEKEKKIPSQPVTNSTGQFEIEASSHNEQDNAIISLRNDNTIDINIGEPLEIDIMDDDNLALSI